MSTWTIPVAGLTCHRCVETVTEQMVEVDGVDDVSIDLVTGGVSTVSFTAPSEISDDVLQAALSDGGAFSISR